MIVYSVQNKINGKKYVGYKTDFNSTEDLLKSDYFGSGSIVRRAVKKYGKNNFERKVILKDIFDFDELCRYEVLWIRKLNTKNPNGYNIVDGGRGTKGRKCSLKSIERNRLSNLGKSPINKGKSLEEIVGEQRAKKIKRIIGEKSKLKEIRIGWNHTEATKEKMKIAAIKRKGKTFEEFYGVAEAKIIKRKLSVAHRGKPQSPEHIQKRIKSHHTQETKEKMSISAKLRWKQKRD